MNHEDQWELWRETMKLFPKRRNLFIDDAAKMMKQKEFVGGVIIYVLAVAFVYVILVLMAGV